MEDDDGERVSVPLAHPGAYPAPAAHREQVAGPAPRHSPPRPPAPGGGVPQSTPQGTPTIATVGLILAFVMPVMGVIVSLVARSRAQQTGAGRGVANAGVAVGIGVLLFWLIAAIPLAAAGR